MGRIGDLFLQHGMTERLIAGINVWNVKINLMDSKTRHSVITPGEVSLKFEIGIEKCEGHIESDGTEGDQRNGVSVALYVSSVSHAVEQEVPQFTVLHGPLTGQDLVFGRKQGSMDLYD